MKLLKVKLGLFLLLPALSLGAMDMGLFVDGTASLESLGSGNENRYAVSGTLIPWVSSPLLGENALLYASAGLTAAYENKEFTLVPELLRTEFTWFFNNKAGAELKAGRMQYSDPLGFIAAGLFDGVSFSMDWGNAEVYAGAWYTGLLYKKNANITMTGTELLSYALPLAYDDFFDTYFAPRRMVLALGYENPTLTELIRLKLALIAQFDLNGEETQYHSQYLVGKLSIPLGRFFVGEAGLCFEAAQNAGTAKLGLAGELGLGYFLPTAIQDKIALLGRFSSGTVEGAPIGTFTPITTESQGKILKAKLSGLSMISLTYTARLLETLSVTVENSYFVRSDLASYQGWPAGKEGYFLGDELAASLLWRPLSDLQINLGGGVFLPSLGNVAKNEPARWRIELSVLLALY
ncbi:hypothetical protein AGMMS50230_17360 [Spirochaetia bacterium]|nr:hypothetical protein AGMMS50230_17360 [Spirochaetia bacterium]